MIWMRMPGQTWSEVATGFLGMWSVMMVAMMMPCLIPMLWRYRTLIRSASGAGFRVSSARLHVLTAQVAMGYFGVYLLLGLFVLGVGIAVAEVTRLEPSVASWVPTAGGVVILLAGAHQFTGAKLDQLRHCRDALPIQQPYSHSGAGLRHGLHIGRLCLRCCAGLMMILLVAGMMNLCWMALITAAITLERFGRIGEYVARASGVIAIAVGIALISRAIEQI